MGISYSPAGCCLESLLGNNGLVKGKLRARCHQTSPTMPRVHIHLFYRAGAPNQAARSPFLPAPRHSQTRHQLFGSARQSQLIAFTKACTIPIIHTYTHRLFPSLFSSQTQFRLCTITQSSQILQHKATKPSTYIHTTWHSNAPALFTHFVLLALFVSPH